MKQFFELFLIACAIATAGAAIDVSAAEVFVEDNVQDSTDNSDSLDENLGDSEPTSTPDLSDQEVTPSPAIGGESESVGEFGSDDSSVYDQFRDFLDSLSGVDLGLVDEETGDPLDSVVSPSPDPTSDIPQLYSDGAQLYSSYDTYYGAIGTTYLEYMRGFLPKLGYKDHYVASRTGQYTYIFAYSDDLSYTGGRFVGSSVTVVTWNTYNNGSYHVSVESSFSLNPGSYLVYSDLTKRYPSLADSAGFTLRQILILLTTFFLGVVIDHMYQVRKIRRIGH